MKRTANDTPISGDRELVRLRGELSAARRELSAAWREFNQAADPDLIEYSIYQINATKARYNYLLRAIKTCQPAVRTTFPR